MRGEGEDIASSSSMKPFFLYTFHFFSPFWSSKNQWRKKRFYSIAKGRWSSSSSGGKEGGDSWDDDKEKGNRV